MATETHWTQPAWNSVAKAYKRCVKCGDVAVAEVAVTFGAAPSRGTPWTPLCAGCRTVAMIPCAQGCMHHAQAADAQQGGEK